MTNQTPTPKAAIAGAVVLGVVMVLAVIVLANRGAQLSENAKTIIIAQLIVAIPSLIGLILNHARTTATKQQVEEMHEELKNGLIADKVEEGVTKAVTKSNGE